MSTRTVAVLAAVMLSIGTFGFFEAAHVNQGADGRAATAQELGDRELGALFGGGCWADEYCVVHRFTCNEGYGYQCNFPIQEGKACFRCENDTQEEKCDGDDWCIPYVTCTDCIVDDAHDCGKETLGTCLAEGGCDDTEVSTWDCGDAFQCHTE